MRSGLLRWWCLCVVALVLVVPAVAHADLGPKVDGCGDVRFIGVKGSGETDDYGREMAALSGEVGRALPSWVEFKSTPVNYPAYGTDLLWSGGIDTYADGIEQGDQALRDLLADVEDECPQELEILAGYSSGAMIVHDILDEFAFDDWATSHVIGVHLLADPRRSPGDPTTRGGANSTSRGIAAIGEWVSLLHGTSDIPAVFAPVTRSWCAAKDPICALEPTSLSGLAANFANRKRHSNYGGTILPNVFVDDAQRLTRTLRLRFPPTTQLLETVATGWPVNIDLKGSFPYGVRFTGISPEIPGLSLAANGRLSGVVSATGHYQADVSTFSTEGGSSTFKVILDVVEPFDMVDFDPDPVVLAPMPIHEPTGVALPGIAPRSVVTLEPEDTMPAGLTLSGAGKLQGRPDQVGDFEVGVRVAKPDGTLRRFVLSMQVVNPAKLVSAAPDGTPSDASISAAIMLDDSRAAFVSAADNLGVENPDGSDVVYLKDIDSGALAHWSPPPDEFVCAIETDPAKANLYIATSWWEDFVNDDGNPDSRERTTIRKLPLAGLPGSGGQLTPSTLTSYAGSCENGAAIAAETARGPVVISANRLDLTGQPLGAGETPERLYVLGGTGYHVVANPPSDGLPWSLKSIVDVRSDGALLVEEQRIVNSGEPGPPASETGYFVLGATGAMRRVDLDAAGQQVKMLSPHFYAGGLVFSMNRNDAPASLARAAVVINSGVLRYKPIGLADPALFDSLGISSSQGIQPLTGNDYAVGCRTYKRSKPARLEPTTVYYGGFQIDSCIAANPNNAPSSYSAAGPTKMLVEGTVDGADARQLLSAAIP